MRHIVKRSVGMLAAVGVLAVAVWALSPRPIPVETTTVARAPLTASVVAEGRTRVKALYVVAAPVDGDLERIVPEPGNLVSPGTTVARIWPIAPRPLDVRSRAEAEAAVAAARAAVTRAEAVEKEAAGAMTHAESLLATARKLVTNGAAASNDLTHAEHEAGIRRESLAASRAAVGAAKADLARAEATVATGVSRSGRPAAVVSSPVSGRVLRVLRESAGPVATGTPLLEIGNTGAIEVVADLLTADAMQIRPGATAAITDWGGEGGIPARVRRVDPAAFTKVSALGLEEQRVRAVLDLVGPPPEGFGHDFRVTVSIAVWERQDVLVIPSTALFRTADHWAVFVVENGRARLKQVVPGRSGGARTTVEQGLTEGEEVVDQPSDLLREGTRVQSDSPARPRAPSPEASGST